MSAPIDPSDAFEVDHRLLHLGVHGSLGEMGWGNLGDWSQARAYDRAARALALRVIDGARVRAGDRVVDAGCGWGEQAVLLARERGAAQVFAIDASLQHVERCRARVGELALEHAVQVRHGNAADLTFLADASVDAVIAVDAAYHFDTRAQFLREACRVLRPGGRVAWTDLVLARAPGSASARRRWQRIARGLAVPAANLWPWARYPRAIADAGLTLAEHHWLTQPVLGGFARFSLRHTLRYALRHPSRGWIKILLSGLGALWCVRSGHVEYGLFVATRPSQG